MPTSRETALGELPSGGSFFTCGATRTLGLISPSGLGATSGPRNFLASCGTIVDVEVGSERPAHVAQIARELGVTRAWISVLRLEDGWPDQVEPGRWLMSDVRTFLRQRARTKHPYGSYCSTCGGKL